MGAAKEDKKKSNV